jgi:hypothetical protein
MCTSRSYKMESHKATAASASSSVGWYQAHVRFYGFVGRIFLLFLCALALACACGWVAVLDVFVCCSRFTLLVGRLSCLFENFDLCTIKEIYLFISAPGVKKFVGYRTRPKYLINILFFIHFSNRLLLL